MKKYLLFVLSIILTINLCFADAASDIAKEGDKKFDELVKMCQDNNIWRNVTSATNVVNNFEYYYGNVMLFPRIDFTDFITDKNGEKYYCCGEKGNLNLFVIKYDPRIQDILYKLNNALGNKSGEFEVIGQITDAFSWWGDVVCMRVVAMRIKGRTCIYMSNDGPILVGQEYLDKAMDKASSTWTKGIPDNAKNVPSNLNAEDTAKWFLYYGSVKKDPKIWNKLCSVQEDAIDASGKLTAKGESWWRMISKSDREYYFVRADSSRDTATEKYFMYQIKVNGENAGVAKPMCVVKEKNGQWKVKSF